jgi:hypothetical protein
VEQDVESFKNNKLTDINQNRIFFVGFQWIW